jgi:hypothetical protein
VGWGGENDTKKGKRRIGSGEKRIDARGVLVKE